MSEFSSAIVRQRNQEVPPNYEILGPEDSFRQKPDREPLLIAARSLRLDPAQLVHGGDMAADILTARNAGALSIGLARPNESYNFEAKICASSPDILIRSLAELPPLLGVGG